MNQTYQEFLEESTNTVKAKRNLGKIILFSTYFVVWIVAMIIFWQINGPLSSAGIDIILRWVLLPLLLLVSTVTVADNNYWGRWNWLCVIVAAVTFATVPHIEFTEELGIATYAFYFPNLMYMAVGIIISVCGIGIGTLMNKKKTIQ